MEVYEWLVLHFTKMLTPVVRQVHSQGHRMNPHFDDLLEASISFPQAQIGCRLLRGTLLALGFVINLTKSTLEPIQHLVHLGAWVRSTLGLVSVPGDKALGIAPQAQ